MEPEQLTRWTVVALILARWAAERRLETLNRRSVEAHRDEIPEAARGIMDADTYRKSSDYTLAKGRLHRLELSWDTVVLLLVLLSGVLPWSHERVVQEISGGAWAMSAWLVLVGIILSLSNLPFDWYSQFHLEERFGFNTTTPKLWWMDRAKGVLIGAAIGVPLVFLVLKLIEWTGALWWLWGWGLILGFQCLMLVVAPILIMPLFNKFTPLPDGSLKDRLLDLCRRTGFPARRIQVMDGSRRSKHSNAFFTGFGRFRKVVLFDTLIEQLAERELEAVLAHEIGHYRRGHIPKMIAWSAASLLAGFFILAMLAKSGWFTGAFGFPNQGLAPALLLFSLLSGTVTFWLSPLLNFWSRRFEYQADSYAAHAMSETQPLVGALRKLNAANLGNLTPHALYSRFYYSHPALLEREAALRRIDGGFASPSG